MAIERTFSIIKPDATTRNLTGAINAMIEKAGLRIVAQKRVLIGREQAEIFYGVHRARPFFRELVDFMTSGPVVVQVLEGENAIAAYRDLMGATDPAKAHEACCASSDSVRATPTSLHSAAARRCARSAVPAISTSGSVASSPARPSRKTGWSSTISTRIMRGPPAPARARSAPAGGLPP